jgi:hypothetical protein
MDNCTIGLCSWPNLQINPWSQNFNEILIQQEVICNLGQPQGPMVQLFQIKKIGCCS